MDGETKYRTKYGMQTEQEAAYSMLESANFRLRFLETMLETYGDDGLELPEYAPEGLARILGVIAHDVAEARFFYCGDADQPGRIDRPLEVRQ